MVLVLLNILTFVLDVYFLMVWYLGYVPFKYLPSKYLYIPLPELSHKEILVAYNKKTFDSYMVPNFRVKKRSILGFWRLIMRQSYLKNANIRVLVSAADVLHSFCYTCVRC